MQPRGRVEIARALAMTLTAVLALGGLTVWAAYGLGGIVGPRDEVRHDGVRQIALRVHAWGFSPNVIRVAPGETV